jgi:hypothetical protein
MVLSHNAQRVQSHDRDRFLASLFVPMPAREALLALAALNVELAQVRRATQEEMIGHIRYAWWQEAVEGLYAGKAPLGHPVLEAMLPVTAYLPRAEVLTLVESYRATYPALPLDMEGIMDRLSLELLRNLSIPDQGWRRASSLIKKHRLRYRKGWNGWLILKLLMGGLA